MLAFCWTLLLYTLIGSYSERGRLVHAGYPYSSDDMSMRQEQLLEKLRGDMSLVVNEEIVPRELRNPTLGDFLMRNMEGQLFSAGVYQPMKAPPLIKKSRPGLIDIVQLSALLNGVCSVLMIDYWNVEWCHRLEIRQFHMEMSSGQVSRDPDYSLGLYEKTSVIRERGEYWNETARIVKIVDYFSKGQECHETNGHRGSEVHIQCCEGLHIDKIVNMHTVQSHPQFIDGEENILKGSATGIINSAATLKAFSEPNVCSYQLVVCSPVLCIDKTHSQSEVASAGGKASMADTESKNQTLSQIMLSLSTARCIERFDEWWTYEICFNSGIRQYHSQEEGSGEGAHKLVVVSEYNLGLAPTALYSNDSALERGSTAHMARNHRNDQTDRKGLSVSEMGLGLPSPVLLARGLYKTGTLKLEFLEGTECDIQLGTKRSATVEIICGRGRDSIIEVKEDRTCHYYFRVQSGIACNNPLMAPRVRKVVTIDFSPTVEK